MDIQSIRKPAYDVVIVGGGFSGIGAGIKLDEAGFKNFLILEAGDGIGGAWHWNTYPGIAVDIPSFSYQFSFAKRTDWSRTYAKGAELKSYAETLVDDYGLRSRIRLNTKVIGQEFDEELGGWRITTAAGDELTARFVIGATGVLTQPKAPDITGVDDFAGITMHTARWNHDVDLKGKRVGIIGTGASAVQVIPSIAPDVAQLVVFQRTPIWCLPRPDVEINAPERFALRRIPGLELAARAASQLFVEASIVLGAHYAGRFPEVGRQGEAMGRRFLRQVRDPEVRAKLTPDYTLGCKRPTVSNDYLAAFNRDNVYLETTPIDAIKPTGVHTVEGVEHPLDVLILATGFKVMEKGNMPAYSIRGTGGADLETFWENNRFQAYEGVSVPAFPNFFMILGPYGYNGQSYFGLIENQMRHIVRLLGQARKKRATRIEVTREANDRFFESMLARRSNQVFFTGDCGTAHSYYFDVNGDVPFRSATSLEASWRSATFDLNDYSFAR